MDEEGCRSFSETRCNLSTQQAVALALNFCFKTRNPMSEATDGRKCQKLRKSTERWTRTRVSDILLLFAGDLFSESETLHRSCTTPSFYFSVLPPITRFKWAACHIYGAAENTRTLLLFVFSWLVFYVQLVFS